MHVLFKFWSFITGNIFSDKHSIKSSLLTVGIDALSDKAMELEYFGRDNDIEHVNECFPDFLAEYRGIKEVLFQAIE